MKIKTNMTRSYEPISTAPKDRKILGYGRLNPGSYDDKATYGWIDIEHDGSSVNYWIKPDGYYMDPTHWMESIEVPIYSVKASGKFRILDDNRSGRDVYFIESPVTCKRDLKEFLSAIASRLIIDGEEKKIHRIEINMISCDIKIGEKIGVMVCE